MATHNLAPYGSFVDGKVKAIADDSFQGSAVNVVRCAAKKINYDLDIIVVPWPRAQSYTVSGKVDGFFSASQQDKRDTFATLSEFIADQTWNWYYLKGSSIVPGHANFKSKAKVASFNGSNMLSYIESQGYNIAMRPLNSEKLYQALIKKRIDAAVSNDQVMESLLNKYNTHHLFNIKKLKNKPLGVYFSNEFLSEQPSFLASFNKAVIECRKPQ